ncbi:hypothetical protein FJ250_12410, partial [bacterium]|nr:hypothetical protein [bacterium]
MICGWNRRRGSERARPVISAALLALTVVATAAGGAGAGLASARPPGPAVSPAALPLPLLLPPAPGSAAPAAPRATGGPPPPPGAVVWAGAAPPDAGELAWLREDRAWLAGPAAASLPRLAAADTVAGAAAGAQDALRRRLAVAIIARGDTVGPLRAPASALRDRWLARGYLQAAVEARGDSLAVDPGGAWTFGDWDVGGEAFPGRERLLADWLPASGGRFEARRLDDAATGLLEALGELGYPFPRWIVSDLHLDARARAVDTRAVLLPGVASRIGPVTSDLEDPRAQRFLVRSSGLRTGAPVRGSDLRRAVERLWARDLWEEVGEPRVYATTAADK